jgi:hypothetical protein
MTRSEIEAVAKPYGVKLNGLGDAAAKLVVLRAAMPHASLSTSTSEAYVDATLADLAGERRDGAQRVVRLDEDDGRADARTMPIKQLVQRTERAQQAFKRDSERAYLEPAGLNARTDTPEERAPAKRADDARADANPARERMLRDQENAWKQPLMGSRAEG